MLAEAASSQFCIKGRDNDGDGEVWSVVVVAGAKADLGEVARRSRGSLYWFRY